jgi:hypothetical protein
MFITVISAFSTVYVTFIQSTLLKTQSLNIRIYSDRKKLLFFIAMYILNKNLKNSVI